MRPMGQPPVLGVTLMTFDKQSNGRRIVVVTTALCPRAVLNTHVR